MFFSLLRGYVIFMHSAMFTLSLFVYLKDAQLSEISAPKRNVRRAGIKYQKLGHGKDVVFV